MRPLSAVTVRLLQQLRKGSPEEFRLIKKYNLAGFLLLYHEVIKTGAGRDDSTGAERPVPDTGRKTLRGGDAARLSLYSSAISSGFSHIDPLQYKLSLERFLPDDMMTNVPDIDLDFHRAVSAED